MSTQNTGAGEKTMKRGTNSKISAMIATALLGTFLAGTAWSASYYVDSGSLGNDASPTGSQASPFKTVTKINGLALKPGDSVFFKRGGVWSTTLLKPASGVEGAPVTYGAYGSGNKPRIMGFYADTKSHVVVQDIEFRNGGNYEAVAITGSHHIALRGCDIIADATNTKWAALFMLAGAHHNEISGCTIAHLNLSQAADAINLRRNADYNLIVNNTIGSATHYALSLEGADASNPANTCSFNVIANNTIHNPEGATLGIQSNSNNNVIQGNTISGGKYTEFDAWLPRSFKNVSMNNIIRYNTIRDNTAEKASGLSMEVYAYQGDPANIATGNHVYNNVITNITALPLVIATNKDPGATANHNYFKNNAIFNNVDPIQLRIMQWETISDNFFHGNLFFKAGTDAIVSALGVTTNVKGIEARDLAHFSGNKQLDPMLDASLQPLAGSPCIDGGEFLTKVVAYNGAMSGTSNVIKVADAGYFSDGLGITSADKVRVGSAAPVAITKIDRVNQLLTLASAVSWTVDAPVSLPYAGARPDIGVAPELTAKPVVPAPILIRVY